MKRSVAIFLALSVWVSAVMCGPLEDGVATYQRQDYATAFKLFKPLADQGYAYAQSNLGFMYEHGQGVPKDDQQAVFWYRKAAAQGNASAQFNLGVMYAKGEGVPKDDQQAYFWWLLASATGDSGATRSRDIVERILPAPQRIAAQAAARDWKPVSQ